MGGRKLHQAEGVPEKGLSGPTPCFWLFCRPLPFGVRMRASRADLRAPFRGGALSPPPPSPGARRPLSSVCHKADYLWDSQYK